MMKKCLLLILFAMTSWPVQGQHVEPRVITLNAETSSVSLNQDLWFYEDKDGVTTEDSLNAPEFIAGFAPLQKKTPNFGFSSSHWWARVPVRNTSSEPVSLVLTEGYALVDHIDFWLQDAHGTILQRGTSGDMLPQSRSQFSYRLPTFKLVLPPGIRPSSSESKVRAA